MRLSYNDMTIDVHFSPSANDLTKDDIVTTAVSLAASVEDPGQQLVDVGICQYVIVRGETGQAHVDVTLQRGPLSFEFDAVSPVDFDF